jgi:hypothetical protein
MPQHRVSGEISSRQPPAADLRILVGVIVEPKEAHAELTLKQPRLKLNAKNYESLRKKCCGEMVGGMEISTCAGQSRTAQPRGHFIQTSCGIGMSIEDSLKVAP